MGIKRCMQINRNNKIKLKKFLKDFQKPFLQKRYIFNNENNELNNKRYQSDKYNSCKIDTDDSNHSKSNNKNKNNETLNNNNEYISESSRKKFGNLSHKSFNYNYPIYDEENTEHFSRLLSNNYLNSNDNKITDSIDSNKNKISLMLKIFVKKISKFTNK